MPVKPNREYRIAAPFRAVEGEEYRVEGYASTFTPYVMYEIEGETYSERIERGAFENADMRDVIMQFDHEGMVFARRSNDSLKLDVDEHGLHVVADLSRTADARNLYEAISTGMVTQMSFAFTVAADYFDRDTRTRVITAIKRVYDVSAVSIPANPDTEIAARSYFNGVIEKARAERLEAEKRERQKRKIKILTEVNRNV